MLTPLVVDDLYTAFKNSPFLEIDALSVEFGAVVGEITYFL